MRNQIGKRWMKVLVTILMSILGAGFMHVVTAAGSEKVLVVGIPTVTEQVDPDFSGALPTAYVRQWVYSDVPLRYDVTKDNRGNLVPDLAKGPICNLCESWEVSPDGKTLTFKFKPGIKSQYGNELTSEDAKWSYERRAFGPSPITKPFFKLFSIDEKNPVTVIDKYTWQLNLFRSDILIAMLGDFFPAPNIIFDSTEAKKHATADDPWATNWLKTNVAGFGPWFVERYSPREEIVLRKNPNYHRPGIPKVDRVIVKEIPSEATRAALLRAGEIDVAIDLPPRLLEELRKAPGVRIQDFAGNEWMAMIMNNKLAPFDDIKVRRAMAHAAPIKEIIKTVYLNKPWVKQFGGYAPDYYPGAPVKWPYEENLEKAKALLREAGKEKINFNLIYLKGQPGAEEVGMIVKTQLARIGVDVNLEGLAPAQYNEQYRGRKAQAVLLKDASWVSDARYWLGMFFGTDGRVNHANNSVPEADKILDEMVPIKDVKKRAELAKKAHELMVQNAPWAFAIGVGFSLAVRDNVTDFVWIPSNLVDVRYLDKK
jgi:peptide/nickel transport system substrate-binding protein